jgi:hypothetical protein
MKDLKTPDDPTLELLIWRRVVSSIQEFSSGSAWRCVGHPSPGDFGAAIKLSKTPDALDALTPTDDLYRFFWRRIPARRQVATSHGLATSGLPSRGIGGDKSSGASGVLKVFTHRNEP